MSLLKSCFEQLAEKKQKALIPFVTAGDPHPDFTVELMHELVVAGADIIELGVPFSDPMADGPVIQAADERALSHHVSLEDVLSMVAQFRQQNTRTPVVLMGYLNPVEMMGYTRFTQRADETGVDGILVVDMPPEEAGELAPMLKSRHIDLIYLIAPTTDKERIRLINDKASGYLYYVSIKGVTGANTLDVDAVAQKVAEIKEISDLPIGVGFGIKDGATAQAVARVADAVVVGSALVSQIAMFEHDHAQIKSRVSGVLGEMRLMMDSSSEDAA